MAPPRSDALLAFASEHPAGTLDRATAEWFLETFGEGEQVIDLSENGERALVAVLVACANQDAASELVILGCRSPSEGVLASLLDQAETRALSGDRSLDLSPPPALPGLRALLARRRYTLAFTNLVMTSRVPALNPPDADFRDLDASNVAAAFECYEAAFSSVSGAQIPLFDDFRAIMLGCPERPRVLVVDGAVAAVVRVVWKERSSGVGEIRFLCRHPARRGERLGSRAVSEALRSLARMGATTAHLEVASTNREALGLYERSGFVVAERRDVFRLSTPRASAR